MKVLMVITSLGMGGAEHVVSNLADELAKGHQVKIAYLTGEVIVSPKNPDIELIPIGMTNAKDSFNAYLKLRAVVKNFKPDVVHSHLVHANIICRMLRPTTTIPRLISSAHNSNEEGRFRMLAYRLTDKLTDVSTNVSDEAVDAFIKQKAVNSDRMQTIHNGIPIADFAFSEKKRAEIRKELKINDDEHLILAVGRLDDSKDYPNLLSAVATLFAKYDNIKLAIAGGGPLLKNLEENVNSLGLKDKVNFLGIRADIPSLMSAADVFTLSSAWEGFGLVVAEAMACNQVVVATDCGGVKEVVGDAGFLVPPQDSQALAAALEVALNLSDDERLQLGIKAHQRMLERYSLLAATEKWLHLYSAAIGDLKPPFTNGIQR